MHSSLLVTFANDFRNSLSWGIIRSSAMTVLGTVMIRTRLNNRALIR